MRRWVKGAVSAAAVALLATGCAGSGGDTGGEPEDGPRALTVWMMEGSAPETLTNELHGELEAANEGVTVNYEVQQWNGIQEKLTTALAGDNPPDVIELGNTQTPQFAAEQVLLDLSGSATELNSAEWLEGLRASGEYDGKQYGMPFFAANREVFYRKDMFTEAGIAGPPTSRAEWLDAITKLNEKFGDDPEFQSLYMPGQNWYTLLSFIWDEGGDVARATGDGFQATLDSAESKDGLAFYQELVESSGTTAPKDSDEQTPAQSGIYGQGKVAMFIGLPWEMASVTEDAPELEAKTGAFPIPSKVAGENAPVFLGGSNLAIPANSKNPELAKEYLKLISSAKYQGKIAEAGMVPGTSKDTSALEADPFGKAMAEAAQKGRAVPASPEWGSIEAGQNPLKDMLTAVLTGAKDIDTASADANAALTSALAG
ncbi:sugar ABC transporter substrate-binding protein [Amycolatopsis cihanbeyliensis]|uniref:N,N'-diacetylchitobiose transport system substrate-binding protein n=1 Tax=Amycolatopsis cihanbeyliensis TaxID=1128664 RepID=A0A542DCX9_AMYCI|nr:sugar ABC transporter substrate-binding protein [Amycolatopsis cihanbeyliensis]TQJ00923.1 N,N'-diacetylchitobiose transport system substrate-binding protein [Amycolatopsis cihanbeyliensis]